MRNAMRRPSRLIPLVLTILAVLTADSRAAAADAQQAPGPSCLDVVVAGVRFIDTSRMVWEGPPQALGYNVYLHAAVFSPQPFIGECLYWSVPETLTQLHGQPVPDETWMFQVTALFSDGEGPLGFTGDCTPVAPSQPCTCTMLADPGPCDAAIPRWYHNFQTGQCEKFIYGGCLGNPNNFENQQACEAECLATCRLPAVVGPCDAAIPRWYFSVLSGHCEEFTWGGCGGNANNFPDEQSCQEACGDLCFLPPDPGPCDAVCPRWFYNPETAQCEEFIWGCCGGNANNFESQQVCEATCLR